VILPVIACDFDVSIVYIYDLIATKRKFIVKLGWAQKQIRIWMRATTQRCHWQCDDVVFNDCNRDSRLEACIRRGFLSTIGVRSGDEK